MEELTKTGNEYCHIALQTAWHGDRRDSVQAHGDALKPGETMHESFQRAQKTGMSSSYAEARKTLILALGAALPDREGDPQFHDQDTRDGYKAVRALLEGSDKGVIKAAAKINTDEAAMIERPDAGEITPGNIAEMVQKISHKNIIGHTLIKAMGEAVDLAGVGLTQDKDQDKDIAPQAEAGKPPVVDAAAAILRQKGR